MWGQDTETYEISYIQFYYNHLFQTIAEYYQVHHQAIALIKENEMSEWTEVTEEQESAFYYIVNTIVGDVRKWNDIIIPTALSYAHLKKDGNIYYQKGNSNIAIQGNDNARSVYLTEDEAFMDNLNTLIFEFLSVQGRDATGFIPIKDSFIENPSTYEQNVINLSKEFKNDKLCLKYQNRCS